MARQSYFGELKSRGDHNANDLRDLFNNKSPLPDKLLKRKRIITRIMNDLAYGNIEDNDYSYFMGQFVIDSIINEAYMQSKKSEALYIATSRLTKDIDNGFMPYQGCDVNAIYVSALDTASTHMQLASLWLNIYMTFNNLKNSFNTTQHTAATIKECLNPLSEILNKFGYLFHY